MREFYTLAQVAEKMGITSKAAGEWCIRGVLNHVVIKVGSKQRYFVPVSEFHRLIENNTRVAKPGRPSLVKICKG